MKTALALACAAAVLGANAAGKPGAKKFSFTLDPGKVHEECLPIAAGAKSAFHWKSSAPVDFNVHFHKGPEVFYPVKKDQSSGDRGTFAARTAEEYCWMWTAKAQAAKIEGEIGAPK